MIGDVWEWTTSDYVPYPGFKSEFDEYNDKWFVNQKVLRGGSYATPQLHIRSTYRNFFHAHERWMVSGFRCARDVSSMASSLRYHSGDMKIYFAGSIRGGRQDAALYHEIVRQLQKHGEVLTEHVADTELGVLGQDIGDRKIHDRDLAWLKDSDYLVAEVTTPSLGVGYEIGKATEWGKPVLCLYRPEDGTLAFGDDCRLQRSNGSKLSKPGGADGNLRGIPAR